MSPVESPSMASTWARIVLGMALPGMALVEKFVLGTRPIDGGGGGDWMPRKRAWSASIVGGALATERWARKPTGGVGSDCMSSTLTPSPVLATPTPSPVMDELGEMWR